jgi:hypothetical protein
MNEKGFDQAEWRRLHAIEKTRLSEARLQAHYAANGSPGPHAPMSHHSRMTGIRV